MAEINNHFLVNKTPPKQDSGNASVSVDPDASVEKPFDQHLQDELSKEVKDSIEGEADQPITIILNETIIDEASELAIDVSNSLVGSEVIEENNSLLLGNQLPVEEVIEEITLEDVVLPTNPILAANNSQRDLDPKSLLTSVKEAGRPNATQDQITELLISDTSDKDLEVPVEEVKFNKKVIDGNQSVKLDVIVNETAKIQKVVQTTIINTVTPTESNKIQSDLIPLQTQISNPVGHKQWGSELARRISVMINNGQQQVAELRLNPAHLGPVSVRLQLDEDQANISFLTNHHAVKEAIEVSIPRLREQLQQQGLELAQIDIEHRNQDQTSADSDSTQNQDNFSSEQQESETAIEDISGLIENNTGVSVFV